MFSYALKKGIKLVSKVMHLALLISLLKTDLNEVKFSQRLFLKVLSAIFNDLCLRFQDDIRITVKMSKNDKIDFYLNDIEGLILVVSH